MQQHFALIGCGKIANRHAENIVKRGVLTSVCDIIPERANDMATRFNARPYYSLESLLKAEEQLTTAVICTPNGLHALHSIQALEKGLHVLCEKPLCISTKDGKAMIAAAEKAGKYLFVVKQNRFNPPVAEIKKLCDENKFGKITSFQINCFWNRPKEYYTDTWKGTKALDGGILYTQFSHFIDLLYWILGDVKDVKVLTKNFSHSYIEFEDTGTVIFDMQNGTIGTLNYTINSFKKNMEGSFTLFGDKGTVKIGGEYLNTLEYQSIENYEIQLQPAFIRANDYGFYEGSMSNHNKVYDHLFDALEGRPHQIPDAREGLKTIEIIEKIYQSVQ
ncbi:MAG: Gfo/Idh/MocA family oxidoreductase [Chitinophagaceae bacterium]|nr:Gfo/Idh/MocA family oxidoreductase [Chitinophagaceae bacterium]